MRKPVLFAGATILGLVLASTGATVATAAPGDTRTSITVDCAVGEGSNDNQVILPGETLTITLLNCIGATVNDDDATGNLYDATATQLDTFPVATSPYVFTSQGESDLEVYDDPGFTYDLDIDVEVATLAPTPTGVLNLTNRLTLPPSASSFTIGLDLIDFDADTFSDDAFLDGDVDCRLEPGYHPYQTMQITISEDGDYTFRVINVTPVDEDIQWGEPYYPSQDFFLAVYTTFDPSNPNANVVGCNDDRPDDNIYVENGGVFYISDDQTPEFVATLAPGTYTLVLTTYRTTSPSEFAAGGFSPWSGVFGNTWTPQDMSGLFELWGPEGSIEVVVAAAPALADTGRDDQNVGIGVALGVLALLLGSVALIATARTRRRATS